MNIPPPPPPPSENLVLKRGTNMRILHEKERLCKYVANHVNGIEYIDRGDERLLQKNETESFQDFYGMEKIIDSEENGPLIHIFKYSSVVELLLSFIYVSRSFNKTIEFMIKNGLTAKIDPLQANILFYPHQKVTPPETVFLKLLKGGCFENEVLHEVFVDFQAGDYRLIDFALRKKHNEVVRILLTEFHVEFVDFPNSLGFIRNGKNDEGMKIVIEEVKDLLIHEEMIFILALGGQFEYIKKLMGVRKFQSLKGHNTSINNYVRYVNIIPTFLLYQSSWVKLEEEENIGQVFEFCEWWNENGEKFVLSSNLNLFIRFESYKSQLFLQKLKFLLTLNYPQNLLNYDQSYGLIHSWFEVAETEKKIVVL